jgi:hypothetical protein
MSSLSEISVGLDALATGDGLSGPFTNLAQLLQLVDVFKELVALKDVDFKTPEGLELVVSTVISVAKRLAALSDSTFDDELVAKIAAEIRQPEVVAFAAYILRRITDGKAPSVAS